MIEPYYIKSVQKQPFADVLQIGAKFAGKHLSLGVTF